MFEFKNASIKPHWNYEIFCDYCDDFYAPQMWEVYYVDGECAIACPDCVYNLITTAH